MLFQRLVPHFTGLVENSKGGASDLVDEHLRGYEMKSYRDPELYPKPSFYVYTNTGGFRPDVPFRYLIVPTPDVLRLLSSVDPRL